MRDAEEEKIRREKQRKRIEYAMKRFDEERIRYSRPNEDSDRFVVFNDSNTKRYQFYAGSGLILGPYEDRGIENMVTIITKERG